MMILSGKSHDERNEQILSSYFVILACEKELVLKESQVYASSWRRENNTQQNAPHRARIHSNSSWVPLERFRLDRRQYYEVDFLARVTLSVVSVLSNKDRIDFS